MPSINQPAGQTTVYDVIDKYSNSNVKVNIPLTTENMNTTIKEALEFKFKTSSNARDNVLETFLNGQVARDHLAGQIKKLITANTDDFKEYKKITPQFATDNDYIHHLIKHILTTDLNTDQIRMQTELLKIVATT